MPVSVPIRVVLRLVAEAAVREEQPGLREPFEEDRAVVRVLGDQRAADDEERRAGVRLPEMDGPVLATVLHRKRVARGVVVAHEHLAVARDVAHHDVRPAHPGRLGDTERNPPRGGCLDGDVDLDRKESQESHDSRGAAGRGRLRDRRTRVSLGVRICRSGGGGGPQSPVSAGSIHKEANINAIKGKRTFFAVASMDQYAV